MKVMHAKILTVLLGLTMILSVFSSAVFAAETPGFELPVKVELSGRPPTYNEDYKIILEADNPEYPMPYGSKNGIFTLTITGENTVKLPRIQYSSIGVYTYKIYQLKGSNKLATYDDTKYHLVVYVTNAEGGSGLETTVLLYLVGEKGKLDEVIFNNKYDRPSRPDKPKPPVRPYEPPLADEEIEIEEEEVPLDVPEPEEPVEEEEEIDEPLEEEVDEPVEEEEEVDEPIIPTGPPDSPPTDKPDVPKTGDDTLIWPYIGLFISGVAMLIILGSTIKKKEINE